VWTRVSFSTKFLKSRRKPVFPVTTEKTLYRTEHTGIHIICSNLKLFDKIYVNL
jgi:hypothetical protein